MASERRRGNRKHVGVHRDFDDARAFAPCGFLESVADVLRVFHVVAPGAEGLRILVEPRVADVGANVASEGVVLESLFRSPNAVVHHNGHDVEVMAHQGFQFLSIEKEAAVAVDAHYGGVRSGELCAYGLGEAEPQPSEVEVVY